MRSENPLTTSGWSPKPSAELTMPSTLTTRLTRSRLPSADLCQHDEASLPCRLSALLHSEVLAEFAFAHPRRACGVARQEQELAALHRVHEVGGWSGIWRQCDVL